MRISDWSSDVFASDLPSKPKAGTLERRSQSRTARFELTDPRSRRDRSPRIRARAGRDGPRERPREQTWAPPSSARRFVINRFLNAAHTSAITPRGLRFLAVRLTLSRVPLGPVAIHSVRASCGERVCLTVYLLVIAGTLKK